MTEFNSPINSGTISSRQPLSFEVFKAKWGKPAPASELTLLQAGSWTRRLLRPLPTWIVLHLTVTHTEDPVCIPTSGKQNNRRLEQIKNFLTSWKSCWDYSHYWHLSLPVPEECTNQDQYRKSITRWELSWLVDSQKHEPCISTYSNEEGKKVLGKKIHTHFLLKRTEKHAQTMIWLDLQPFQHITFHTLQTESKKAAICCQSYSPHCWTSEGAALIWLLALFIAKPHIRKLTVIQISVGPSPVLSLLPLENPCSLLFLPLASSDLQWLSCQLGQQQSWSWASESCWTKQIHKKQHRTTARLAKLYVRTP